MSMQCIHGYTVYEKRMYVCLYWLWLLIMYKCVKFCEINIHSFISSTNVYLSSLRSSDVHLRAISLEIKQSSVTTISLKIIFLRFSRNLPGAYQLKVVIHKKIACCDLSVLVSRKSLARVMNASSNQGNLSTLWRPMSAWITKTSKLYQWFCTRLW